MPPATLRRPAHDRLAFTIDASKFARRDPAPYQLVGRWGELVNEALRGLTVNGAPCRVRVRTERPRRDRAARLHVTVDIPLAPFRARRLAGLLPPRWAVVMTTRSQVADAAREIRERWPLAVPVPRAIQR